MPHGKLTVISRGRRNGWRNERLLGKTFLDRQHEVVLQIGSDAWTRDELVSQVKCGNVNAARLLSKAASELQVDSAKQMAARISLDELFALRHVGITTVYVWLCVLEAMQRNPLDWVDRDDEHLVTLTTEKLRVKKAQLAQAQLHKDARRPARAHAAG